ncbi:MAG TPA: DUF1800 domain-containing protein [Hanamia sp.]|nr:DUF1800 domain-containing protein [Hanamia sp.]
MAVSNQQKNQHLLWRAAFGPMAENANQIGDISQKNLYEILLKTSSKKPVALRIANGSFDGLVKGIQGLGKMENLSKEQKKQLRKQSAEDIKNLNLLWLGEMINSEAQLREKMSFFWHGHFACRVINIFFQQQLLNVIRENALGNFGDLLREVSKSPAMLSFLNNQQNRKQHPNENFAREVMELFTMGRETYTENDVKEGARAYTGWGFNMDGEFVFRPFVHDNGQKTFLGKTGNFNGDDVVDIILEQRATANFIAKKIYKFFVNENVDDEKVSILGDRFYRNNYDIKKLLADIFTSDWFYQEKNIGTRIKSPVELLVGIRRLLPMEPERPELQLLFEKILGQVLFYPPNVAGWPGGQGWIDSSALMFRLKLPQLLTNSGRLLLTPKEDDDVMMGREGVDDRGNGQDISVNVDWNPVFKVFANTKRENLSDRLNEIVLQTKTSVNPNVLKRYTNNSSREEFIKSTIVELMSTPEYQLC